MSAGIRSSIRNSLLATVAAFNSGTATAEQAELAAAQVLAADELAGNQPGSAFDEGMADPNSKWKLFVKDFLSNVTHDLPSNHGSITTYPNVVDGKLYMAGRHLHTTTGSAGNAVSAFFAVGDINGEKTLTSYQHSAAAVVSNQPAQRVQVDPVRGPYVFGNDANVGSYYYGIGGQAAGPGFALAAYAWHKEFARSIVAGTNKQVSTSTDSQTGYTSATIPDLSAVSWNQATAVFCTPTAVLIPTGNLHTASNGFLRSTDGVTYSLIPGIVALGSTTNPFTADYINGRLFMCTSRGLWSTADNGTTWRNDIATTASIEQIFVMSDGRLLAVGAGGIWHGAADGTGFTRVSTTNPPAPRVLIPEQRLLYAANGVYTETGTMLVSVLSLDWNLGRCMSGQNVVSSAQYGGLTTDFQAPVSNQSQLIPDGPNSIILLKNATTSTCAPIRQAFPVYVPPRTGQRVRIVAVGAGGDIGNGSVRSFAGSPTTVSNLLVAAGGPATTGFAVSQLLGRPGGVGVPIPAFNGATGNEMMFRAKGGTGTVIKGRNFGDGITIEFFGTIGGSVTLNQEFPIGAPNTLRAGSGAIPVSWTGTITDPLPMVIPSRRHSRSVNASASPSSGTEYALASLRGAEWGEAPGGAVAILEI